MAVRCDDPTNFQSPSLHGGGVPTGRPPDPPACRVGAQPNSPGPALESAVDTVILRRLGPKERGLFIDSTPKDSRVERGDETNTMQRSQPKASGQGFEIFTALVRPHVTTPKPMGYTTTAHPRDLKTVGPNLPHSPSKSPPFPVPVHTMPVSYSYTGFSRRGQRFFRPQPSCKSHSVPGLTDDPDRHVLTVHVTAGRGTDYFEAHALNPDL